MIECQDEASARFLEKFFAGEGTTSGTNCVFLGYARGGGATDKWTDGVCNYSGSDFYCVCKK